MPYTLNGVGTTYYGNTNSSTRQGICHSCKRQASLTSYDTMHWFVVLFVPLIPLGRKRIIDQCGHCRRHLVMELSAWNNILEQRDESALLLKENPTDPQLAKQLLRFAVTTNDLTLVDDVTRIVEKHMPDNLDLWLSLASCYAHFQRYVELERVLYSVVALDSNPSYRLMLADTLLRLKKPDDAVPFLTHIVENNRTEDAEMLVFLGQVYQELGRHEEALLAFENAGDLVPDLGKKKELKKTIKKLSKDSQSLLARSQMGAVEKVQADKTFVELEKKKNRKRMGLVAAIIVALVFSIISIISFAKAYNHTIYLVNGMPRAYTVQVNGKSIQLPALRTRRMHVAEGTVEVTCTDPLVAYGTQTMQYTSSFFGRLFDDRVIVLNPDRAAILEYQTIIYAKRDTPDVKAPPSVVTGGQFEHVFKDIDFVFKEAPGRIDLDANQKSVTRYGLNLIKDDESISIGRILYLLEKDMSKESLVTIATQRYLAKPDDVLLLSFMRHIMDTDKFVAILKPSLDTRPVQIDVHRQFQIAMEQMDQKPALIKLYQDMIDKEPGNKDLLYLASRLLNIREYSKIVTLLRKASEGPDPNVYALNWLANVHMENGLYEQAATYCQQLITAGYQTTEHQVMYMDCLTALGKVDEAEAFAVKLQNQVDLQQYYNGFYHQAYHKQLQNDQKGLHEVVIRFEDKLKRNNVEEKQWYVLELNAELAYVAGMPELFSRFYVKQEDWFYRFKGFIAQGDVASASDVIDSKSAMYTDYLTLFIAARNQNDQKIATNAINSAIGMLLEGTAEDRELAKMLAGKSDVTLNVLYHLPLGYEAKKLVLVALGLNVPKVKQPCFEAAKKLNFDHHFPYLTVAKALSITTP